jgi:hypothetical protein
MMRGDVETLRNRLEADMAPLPPLHAKPRTTAPEATRHTGDVTR